MKDKQAGWQVVSIGKHIFQISSARRIHVLSLGNHDEEELRLITKEWEEYRAIQPKHCGKPFSGHFRWCLNYPNCQNAFYARPDKIREGKAWYCLRDCVQEGLGVQNGLLKQFLNLSEFEAACWIVDNAKRRQEDPEFVSHLIMLLESEVGPKIREAFWKIKGTKVARDIVVNFLRATEEEKKILLELNSSRTNTEKISLLKNRVRV